LGDTSVFDLAKNDAVCHIKANFIFLSSFGKYGDGNEERCSAYFSNISPEGKKSHFWGDFGNSVILLVSLAFSMAGYYLIFYYNKKETQKTKKYFLRLIALYFVLGFLIMFFISGERMSYERYFRFGFFMPYVFLGLLTKWMSEKFSKIYIIPATLIFLLLILSNADAISKEVSPLLSKTRTCSSSITTMGEIESVAEYMISHSKSQNMINFGVDTKSLPAFYDPLVYLLRRQNISSNNVGIRESEINQPAFILSCEMKKRYQQSYKKINSVYIYQVGE
jgi:hypothetical protein